MPPRDGRLFDRHRSDLRAPAISHLPIGGGGLAVLNAHASVLRPQAERRLTPGQDHPYAFSTDCGPGARPTGASAATSACAPPGRYPTCRPASPEDSELCIWAGAPMVPSAGRASGVGARFGRYALTHRGQGGWDPRLPCSTALIGPSRCPGPAQRYAAPDLNHLPAALLPPIDNRAGY